MQFQKEYKKIVTFLRCAEFFIVGMKNNEKKSVDEYYWVIIWVARQVCYA
jgi:hypothetical protein